MFPRLITLAAIAASLAALPAAAQEKRANPLLNRLFQDHAVLQRDRPIAIWGEATGGETVRLTLGGNSVTVTPGQSGLWHATLPAMPAGGPYTLTAEGRGRTETATDVMIGDVWLCSGQSNMEFELRGSLGGPFAIATANDPGLRILSVAHETGVSPGINFANPVSWQPASPQSVGDFSAACYFMGRDLRGSQKVAIGLIDASWGGTPIDAWRAESTFAADPAFRDQLALFAAYRADPAGGARQWGELWGAWWREKTGERAGTEPWQANAPGNWRTVPSFTQWEGWGVPELAAFNGIVWYRTEITLTAAQAKQASTLLLGPIDDTDMTWINTISVGGENGPGSNRAYPVKPGTFHAGRNRITIAAIDVYAGGGMIGDDSTRGLRLADGTLIPLPAASGWQYRVSPAIDGEAPHAPWDGSHGIAGIYNGMIAPLGNYGLRGVAWYQGESDWGYADGYDRKLGALMASWRAQFGNADLPFLIVQLAGYGDRDANPRETGFGQIRDEQRKAVAADAHAALIVMTDLGEPNDIHPTNKLELGHRLSRAATILTYGGTGAASGPMPLGATRSGDTILVRFSGAEAGLRTYSSGFAIGFELCGPARGSCRFVPATINGDTATIPIGTGPADRIRFCWGDSPVCNLYDANRLPVTPFELRVAP